MGRLNNRPRNSFEYKPPSQVFIKLGVCFKLESALIYKRHKIINNFQLVFPALLARGQHAFDVKRSSPVLPFCAVIPRGLATGIGAGRAKQIYSAQLLNILKLLPILACVEIPICLTVR